MPLIFVVCTISPCLCVVVSVCNCVGFCVYVLVCVYMQTQDFSLSVCVYVCVSRFVNAISSAKVEGETGVGRGAL